MLSQFTSLLMRFRTGQGRDFMYFHVAVYVGSYDKNYYVVENGGGHPETRRGTIELITLEEAFHEQEHGECRYFIVSPPKDAHGNSTRYLVWQKALASVGVEFTYHECCKLRNICHRFIRLYRN